MIRHLFQVYQYDCFFFTVKLHYIVHTMIEQFGLIGYPVVLLTFYR